MFINEYSACVIIMGIAMTRGYQAFKSQTRRISFIRSNCFVVQLTIESHCITRHHNKRMQRSKGAYVNVVSKTKLVRFYFVRCAVEEKV